MSVFAGYNRELYFVSTRGLVRSTTYGSIFAKGTLTDIISIASSKTHFLALDSEGSVWAVGDNTDYQMGITSTAIPKKIPRLCSILQIGVGSCMSLFLDQNGIVYFVGTLFNDIRRIPKPVESPPILSISVSDFRYLLLDYSGKVWAMGDNNGGQLGLGEEVHETNHLQMIPDLPPVKFIVSHNYFSIFIDCEDKAWSCGRRFIIDGIPKSNQGKNEKYIFQVEKIESCLGVEKIFCQSHTHDINAFFLNKSGELWCASIQTSDGILLQPFQTIENLHAIYFRSHGSIFFVTTTGELYYYYSGSMSKTDQFETIKIVPHKQHDIAANRAKSARK